jgi:hypothetical protein
MAEGGRGAGGFVTEFWYALPRFWDGMGEALAMRWAVAVPMPNSRAISLQLDPSRRLLTT